MDYEKEILQLKSEIAEIKKIICINKSKEKSNNIPTKRFYLCKLEKEMSGDRYGSWNENNFVPLYRFINGKKCFYEFDTKKEAVEFGKNNSWPEKIYVKDSDTDQVVRPKNVKV